MPGWGEERHGRGALTGAAQPQLPALQGVLFTAPVLEQLTCEQSSGTLHRLLRVAPSQQPLLQAYRALVCNGSRAAREERFALLAAELRDQLDVPKIISRVRTGLGHGCRSWRVVGLAAVALGCRVSHGAGLCPRLLFPNCWGLHWDTLPALVSVTCFSTWPGPSLPHVGISPV